MLKLEVTLLSPGRVIFQGQAASVILPGEAGVFEVLPLHKRLLTRLLAGSLFVDERRFEIRRGIAQVDQNRVTAVVEEH